ncbi:hypothetical protein DSAG12_01455 [Promethearchaeum syntrophicum]|uniref:Uncharacterized protein n=1 Tax=Promethearchaeum syntrophicum TaxID=2594042 RepID=A0A5B9D904_9ARCH|nr:hypothetical protein [Candidatus Prometheoarchaeum syntrophicum]QEE15629.1 hypothetical protein DSAG12_01455 [Candidatus Prometheoarchaeum syntrophicum]
MKAKNEKKNNLARKLLAEGLTFDNIVAQIKKNIKFDSGISRKKLVELRKEMIENRILDNNILKKFIVPFAKLGVEVDLEPNEKERIKFLFEEVKSNGQI